VGTDVDLQKKAVMMGIVRVKMVALLYVVWRMVIYVLVADRTVQIYAFYK